MTDTVWSRLEPRPRSDSMDDGLRADIRDPMWLLSRQWQLSEFHGEDAGSPVRADVDVAEDAVTRVDPQCGGRDDGEPLDYDGAPLEATVERELVTDDPPLRLRVEAGQQFLRTLARAEDVGEFGVEDFPEALHVDPPEEALEAPDRRYVELVDGRAVDGTAVARAIRSAVDNIDDVVDPDTGTEQWSGVSPGALPVPDGARRSGGMDDCLEAYYAWYVGLYDEPAPEEAPSWNPTRLEYQFAVATGEADTESVLQAPGYEGGDLDWYHFDAADGSLDPPTDGATTERSVSRVPTQVSFPGMPTAQWWTFEQGDVDLTDVAEDDASVSRLVLAEFATQYGNDWFRFSLSTPVGTLSRITDLTVTDAFGVEETAEPREQEGGLFAHAPSGHDEPGLFLAPTMADSLDGDPVEAVTLSRDELANLAFALERRVEGPTGRSIDRTEFAEPAVAVEEVSPAAAPAEEYVRLRNPGEDRLDLSGHRLVAEGEAFAGGERTVRTFGDRVLRPQSGLTVHSGAATGEDVVGGTLSESVWGDADALAIRAPDDHLVHRHLLARPSAAFADYRLSTDVPDYWFPFTAERETGSLGLSIEHRLERSLLLDADSLGLPIEEIPRPMGEILTPDLGQLPADEDSYLLYDEEVPRAGRQVKRRYRFARWTDGRGYCWSGRTSRLGDTQLDSGLAFDVLEERDG